MLLAQVSWTNLLTVIGIMVVIQGGALGIMWNSLGKTKDTVQYKDNCNEIVKRQDERHQEIKDDLKEIKDLIKNQGQSTPRVQT